MPGSKSPFEDADRIPGRPLSVDEVPTVAASPSVLAESVLAEESAEGSIDINMASTADAVKPATATPFIPVTLKERYPFRKVLGQGGFGLVYEAWDELLHRQVAIKVARRECFDDSKGQQQFLDEARAAAKLNHPHIVKVYDCGTDSDGNPFVVFEFIDGESLAERIKRHPLNQDEIFSVMISVAEAMQAAHKIGLIHRDLKPANILLDHNGKPYVTDFGLAVDEHSQREQAGVIAGSWPYMSPEQYRGETQYFDGRTDIWSLGVILYELMAKRRPFSGRNVAEIRDEVLNREPKPLRQIDDSISTQLEQICLRCLAKPISERYPSSSDVASALRSSARSTDSFTWVRLQWSIAVAVTFVLLIAYGLYRQQIPSQKDSRTHSLVFTNDDGINPTDAPPIQESSQLEPSFSATIPLRGKWFSPLKLKRPPEILVWPQDMRNSRWEHRSAEDELWVQCESMALFKLMDVSDTEYKFQLDLFQSPWVGEIGLFFGGHPTEANGTRRRQIQLIKLVREADRMNSLFFVHRILLTFNEQHKLQSSRILCVSTLPKLLPREQSLRIRVQQNQLTHVEWNDNELHELISDDINSYLMPLDATGDLGIYIAGASAVFRHSELLLTGDTK